MANYHIFLTKKSQKALDKLNETVANPIFEVLEHWQKIHAPMVAKNSKEELVIESE